MPTFEDLPPSLTTLYAELLQQVKTAEATRTVGRLKGTFVSKTIKGKSYWYLQYSCGGRQQQIYLGPEGPELLTVIREHQQGREIQKTEGQGRRKLCAMLVKGGLTLPDSLSCRVLLLLAASGVFRLGAVVVGSHAFLAMTGLLGIRWTHPLRTQDIDLAQNAHLSLALGIEEARIDLPNVLEQAKIGFFPIPPLNHKHPSTSFKMTGKEIHLDILTPLTGRETEKPVPLPSLKASAQPLRFLDFLIEDTVETVIPYDEGLLIRIPDPARFAVHKLIVSGQRTVTQHVKAKKDLTQAASLLDFLFRDRRSDLEGAWKNLKKRGKGWTRAAEKGLSALKRIRPDLADGVEELF